MGYKYLQNLHPRFIFNLWQRHKNFREIAHCMHIIAMVGLHRLKKKASKRYYHLFIIKELFKGTKLRDDEDIISVNEIYTGDYETDLLANNIEQFVLVYLSSDRSCSGLINGGIFKAVKAIVSTIKNQYKTVRLVCIGKKGFRALKSQFRYDFYKVFLDIDLEKNSFAVCYVIVYKIMKLQFEKGLLLFNKFIDIQVQIVSYYRFFSFSFLFKKIFYEQHKNKFFRRLTTLNKVDDYSLLDFYRFSMTLLILDALKENSFSEIACRARAMETIMQNLDVLINHFWINYQKARQRKITDEIIECLNGANVANEYSIDARREAEELEKTLRVEEVRETAEPWIDDETHSVSYQTITSLVNSDSESNDTVPLEVSDELLADYGLNDEDIDSDYFDLGYINRNRKYDFPLNFLNKEFITHNNIIFLEFALDSDHDLVSDLSEFEYSFENDDEINAFLEEISFEYEDDCDDDSI